MSFSKKIFPAFGTGIGTLASSAFTLGLVSFPKSKSVLIQESVFKKPEISVRTITPTFSTSRGENEFHGNHVGRGDNSEKEISKDQKQKNESQSISSENSSKIEETKKSELDSKVSEPSDEEDKLKSSLKSSTNRKLNKELEKAIKETKEVFSGVWKKFGEIF